MSRTDVKQVKNCQTEDPNLEAVLAAWHMATVRLEETHKALRGQVARLTDELEVKNRELARKNRLADLGQMASHVAHEVRNNLVPTTLYMSLLRRRLAADSECLGILDKIDASFTALDATVNDLLSFTAEREPLVGSVDVRGLVDEVLESLAPQLAAQEIHTELDVPFGLRVMADYDMLRRAVLNLTLNALDAMPDGGDLVYTGVRTADGVEIEVADSGPGLNDEVLTKGFEPFFTTKSHGTGLGLAIVGRVAEVHGGRVWAVNCPEGGAAFTLCFPRRVLEAAA
jgi:signal transduction histidine kinase